MDCLRIIGGARLHGTAPVGGSKNASLPILAASILSDGPVVLGNVPELADVDTLALLLGHLGVEVKRQVSGDVHVHTVDSEPTTANYDLVRRMRASFCVLGPLIARRGRAMVSLPGGCNIGTRPVDLHLAGLAALGADIRIERGYVIADARRLRGAEVHLVGPQGPTVTGTANVMSAATLARGRTIIRGAVREPEIVDLGGFLIAAGARIEGLGTDVIEIVGVEQLHGAHYRIIADRIETGTLLISAAITGGAVTVEGAVPAHLAAVLEALVATGARIECLGARVSLRADGRPKPLHITGAGVSGHSHRFAIAVHGTVVAGPRDERHSRCRLSGTIHADCGAESAWRSHRAAWLDGDRAWRRAVVGSRGGSFGLACQRRAGIGGLGGRARDESAQNSSSGSWVRASGAQAGLSGRENPPPERTRSRGRGAANSDRREADSARGALGESATTTDRPRWFRCHVGLPRLATRWDRRCRKRIAPSRRPSAG